MEHVCGKVIEILEDNGLCLARIDCEALYPGGGGQPCDQAILIQNGLSFSIHETRQIDDQIFWVFSVSGLEIGDITINRDEFYRLEISQQHTVQHIFSGLAFQKYGWKSDGFTIFPEDSKIELIGADLDLSKFEWLEQQTNFVISRRIPVEIAINTPGEDLKKSTIPEHNRVVSIKEVDRCYCGGTHVSSTDQIGSFSILTVERKNKESVRVTFVAGLRLAKMIKQYKNDEKKLKNLLKGDIWERVEILLKEYDDSQILEKNLLSLIADLVPSNPPIFRRDALPLSLEKLKYLSLAIQQRGISSSLINQEGYFVLSGQESDKLFEELKCRGAKGGGKGVITGKLTNNQ